MDSMFNTPQEVVQANMNGAVKKAATSKKKVFFMSTKSNHVILSEFLNTH